MQSLLILINTLFSIYIFFIFAQVIMSWLVAFNVINTRNQFVYMVGNFLYKITEPALRPIRRVLPAMGGLDLSPIILLVGLYFVRNLINEYWPM